MSKIMNASGRPFTDLDAAKTKASIITSELGLPYKAVPCDGGYCVVPNSGHIPTEKIIGNPAESGNHDVHLAESNNNEPTAYQQEVDAHVPPEHLDEQNGGIKRYKQERLEIKPSMWGYPGMFLFAFFGVFVFFDPNTISTLLLGGQATNSLEGVTLLVGKGLGVVIIVFALGRVAIEWMANVYIIDLNTAEARLGILSKKKMRINIKDIRSIDMTQGIIERMCVVGTVSLATAGTSGDEIIMRNVAYPSELQNVIQSRLDNFSK